MLDKIQNFRSDSSGEYMFHEFQEYLQQNSIASQCFCHDTPQQNEIVE